MRSRKIQHGVAVLVLTGPLFLCGADAFAQCVPSGNNQCTELLHVVDVGPPLSHMQYGDTITLRTNGQNTWIDENVDNWNNPNPILLRPTIVVVTNNETGADKIELVWRFDVRVDNHDVPAGPNVQHTELTLRRVGDEVEISGALHPNGEIHGGTAHLR